MKIKIGDRAIGEGEPAYFIADIAANHDGDINRAFKLIKLAKENGANAVKFQHHNVNKYVSDFGFKQLGTKLSHQKSWDKTIFEVYKDAEVPLQWTSELARYSSTIGITFFSTPYDLDMIDHLDSHVPAYKIGSGDINWDEMLIKVAEKNKPVFLGCGASNIGETQRAVQIIKNCNSKVILMQCNTNYTGSHENFRYVNLNVLKTFKVLFPDILIGLSDHTPGNLTALGSVALGGKVIEKHFTDDVRRKGPDHKFSIDPSSWREMVSSIRLLESALGNSTKDVEENERETVILQRRSIRVIRNLKAGEKITKNDIQFQRPAPRDSFPPNSLELILNRLLVKNIVSGDYLRYEHIKW